MIKVVQNFSSFFGSIWLARPLTVHNTVHWSVRHTRVLTCKIFLSATCTLDEPDKHFSHKLLLYFAFFVKLVKSLTYLRNAKQYRYWWGYQVLVVAQSSLLHEFSHLKINWLMSFRSIWLWLCCFHSLLSCYFYQTGWFP
jgi:hypothetical protein